MNYTHVINHESELFSIWRAKAIEKYECFFEAVLQADIKEEDLKELLKSVLHISDLDKRIKKTSFTYDDKNIFYPYSEVVIFFDLGCFCYASYKVDDDKNPGKTMTICGDIRYYGDMHNEEKITTLFSEILKFNQIDQDPNKFYVVASDGRGGLGLKKEKIVDIELDIELNYGKEFLPIYEKIFKSLKDLKSGLVLFHGPPGTGKTNLIRYIIKQLNNVKQIIYLPSFLMNDLANPEFIGFLRNQKDSILILEDAEEVLAQREEGFNNQAVSNILNLTGGLLNDSMRIQIIATFNMDKKLIDKALLRPGRLIAEHRLGPLNKEEATILSKKLGINKIWEKEATLAEIYIGDVQTSKRRKKRVGIKDEDEQ